tara:strand:- start:1148 stop:1561 length:414 start_codon:yes stop_codon:yes gene_type:complete
MAGGVNLDDDDTINEINVTPFVDVMLVLLVIFMVTANYMNNAAIELKLPEAATGKDPGSSGLEFSLDGEGQLYLNSKKISFAGIKQAIATESQGKPVSQALISADEKTPHGQVIKLIDAVRKNGIKDFAIQVEVDGT